MSADARLLVVDDEELNCDMLSRRLARCGFTVDTVQSGRKAIGCIERGQYDAVLLDSMMPEMSGLEVLKLVRAVHSPTQLPVIMVTAVTDSQKIAEAIGLGANDYVTKPIDFPVALARIRSQVALKRAESALRVSEERYALAARSSNDGLWDWDLKSGRVYYSTRWKEMLGFGEHEIGDSPDEWLSRILTADRADVEARLRDHVENRIPSFEHEYQVLHRDGSSRWMIARAMALRDDAGKAVRLTGSQADVTAKKTTDSLTGLGNRVLLQDRLQRLLENPFAEGRQPALLFLDLDRFKLVNDSLGHLAGDCLLIEAAARIREAVRTAAGPAGATVVRMGGDEFAVLLPDARTAEGANGVAEAILRSLNPRFRLVDRDVYCSASIGVALVAKDHGASEGVIRDADTAMYAAKASGRGRAAIFDGALRDRVSARLEIENELRAAMEKHEFLVYYQPSVHLQTGRICGFEALLRWQHPQRGLITPSEFIPVAEETGMINELGLWVVREACRQMKQWQTRYPCTLEFEISVNLSPGQCREPSLIGRIRRVLEETDLAPSSLQLEVTESVLLADVEEARRIFADLKALGVGLKIDDFGTGYSSLKYLAELPFDSLKIDQSFISRLTQGDRDSQELVRTIVQMAQNLRLETIAEGVENSRQISELLAAGCEFGQGYYYSCPVSADLTEQLIRDEQAKGCGR